MSEGKASEQQQQLTPEQERMLADLQAIDQQAEQLHKEEKLLESLNMMEKSLILRGKCFGLDSVEVLRACKSVGEMCNYLAMNYLQGDNSALALELLKKAEVLTERHKVVRAVTLNNLGCYYRKAGKLRTALRYVTDALKIEAGLPNSAKASDTHLNMCTILSELGAHDKAVLHARMALKLLLIELFGPPPEPAGAEDGQEEEEKAPELPADRVAVLAIAYHNLAVQQECLSKYPQSLESYDKALKVVTKHLGQAHPLASTLGESLKVATAKLQPKIDRQRNIDHDANERRRQALGMTTSKRRSKQPSSPSSSKVQQQQQQHDDLNTSVASNDGEEELTQEELPQESLYVSEGEL